ncbi:MAG TPA: YqgE/AlgH family protein [Vicinamibacterales bacterium]|nr:YqgE/AlgH family protein [Vicinamibacterales bacterium]
MADSLAPALLLSMPQLLDPNFTRTVVLLCEHAPEGAFGLVLNRPTDVSAATVVRLDPPVSDAGKVKLWIGGPVEPQRGWILVDEPFDAAETRRIVDGLYLSSSPLLLRRLLERETSCRARVLAGYAGWGPGQLDEELAQSSWLLAEVQTDLIFETEPALMWETAIRRLGADPSTLHMSRGVH